MDSSEIRKRDFRGGGEGFVGGFGFAKKDSMWGWWVFYISKLL